MTVLRSFLPAPLYSCGGTGSIYAYVYEGYLKGIPRYLCVESNFPVTMPCIRL